MLLNHQQLEQYRRDGYVIIDAPFSKSLTDDCLAAVRRVARDPAEVAVTDGKKNHFTLMPIIPDSYFSSIDHSLPFLRVSLHPELVEIGRQILGTESIYMRNAGVNELAPGRSTGWHYDANFEYPEFMHYFSGASVDNGCLRVVPGSEPALMGHLPQFVQDRRRQLGIDDAGAWLSVSDVEVPGELPLETGGDKIIVRRSQIFHATYVNRTSTGRFMHHWLYRGTLEGGFRMNWSRVLTPMLAAELTPDQRRVLRLDHDDPIAPPYRAEAEAFQGRVYWSV